MNCRGIPFKKVRARGARAAGVFPLRFGGQAILSACHVREPLAISHGGMVGHGDSGSCAPPPTLIWRTVRRGGSGYRVHRPLLPAPRATLAVVSIKLPPADLSPAHPERAHCHSPDGAFVRTPIGFRCGASHQKRPAGHRDHLKLDSRARDRLGVVAESSRRQRELRALNRCRLFTGNLCFRGLLVGEVSNIQMAVNAVKPGAGPLVMQMSIRSFLGEPPAEEIRMTLDATRIEGEGSRAVQQSLGLPVNCGSILEECSVNVLDTQTCFLQVMVNTASRWKVAVGAVRDHTTLVGEVGRLDP